MRRTIMACLLLASGALCSAAAAQAVPDAPDEVAPQAEAKFTAPLELLTSSWPGVGGDLTGPATVYSSWTAQADGVHRTIVITSERPHLRGHALGKLEVVLRLPPTGRTRVDINLTGGIADQVTFTFEGNLEIDVRSGELTWTGGPAEGRLFASGLDGRKVSRIWPEVGLWGKLDIDASMHGTSERPVIDATVTSAAASWRDSPSMPLAAKWHHEDDISSLDVSWGVEGATMLDIAATVPVKADLPNGELTWLERGEHDIQWTATKFDERFFVESFDLPPGTAASIDSTGAAKGSLDKLDMRASVTGELRHNKRPPLPLSLTLTVDGDEQKTLLKLGELLSIDLTTKAGLGRIRRDKDRLVDVPMAGMIKTNAALKDLAPYLPESLKSPVGNLTGSIALAGTLGEPSLNGQVELQRGAVTLVDLNQRLSPLRLRLRFEGSKVSIEGLEGKTGDGAAVGKGQLILGASTDDKTGTWDGWTLIGSINLELVSFPLVQQAVPLGLVDGKIDVTIERRPDLLAIDLDVSKTRVALTEQDLPDARSIPENRSVRLLDWLGRAASDNQLFGDGEQARLRVALVDPIAVKGARFSMNLGGEMTVRRKGRVVTVVGGFAAAPDGQFQLFDNDFVVRRGTVTLLPGVLGQEHVDPIVEASENTVTVELNDPDRPVEARPLDPILDFVAAGRVVDTIVLVQVRGTATQPELVLVSNPPLPEYQILTLLITGRVDAVDEENGEVRREVASLVRRFHNPSLKRQLFDRMGIDNLGLGFGSSVTEPIVTVGKQINRQLYIETVYYHNAPPEENEKEGRIEYRLDPRWTVDTTVGDAGNGNVGLFWTFSFGGPPPPGPDALDKIGDRPIADRDGDGLPDTTDQCVAEPEDKDGFRDEDGCPDLDNDNDGVLDVDDAAPMWAETDNGYRDGDGAPDKAPSLRSNIELKLSPITFPPGSQRPKANNAALLAIRTMIDDLDGVTFEVVGHADGTGGPAANQRISELRAQAVKDLLVRQGVEPARLMVMGRAAREPLDDSGTLKGRARNRRVELEPVLTDAERGEPATEPTSDDSEDPS